MERLSRVRAIRAGDEIIWKTYLEWQNDMLESTRRPAIAGRSQRSSFPKEMGSGIVDIPF